jgi:hypothetical protein
MFPVYENGDAVEIGSYKRKSALGALRDDLGSSVVEEEEVPEDVEEKIEEDGAQFEAERENASVEIQKEPEPTQTRSNLLLDYREIEELRADLIRLENLRYATMRELVEHHLKSSGDTTKNVHIETARYFVKRFNEKIDIPKTAVVGSHTEYLSALRERVKDAAIDLQNLKRKLKFSRGER